MGAKVLDGTAVKFRGGLNSSVARVLLDSGEFSTLKNVTPQHPGFKQRKGHTEHNTTNVADDKTVTLFQLSKSRRTERRLFRQLWDESEAHFVVEEASANPPSTSDTFGAEILPGLAGAIPASWAVTRDMLLYADKVRQGKYYTGERYPIRRVKYYSQAGAPSIAPDAARELTAEVKDDGNTLEAPILLDNVGEVLYIGCEQKINRLYFGLGAAVNNNAVTLSIKYHNQGYVETEVSNLDDGTITAGATMAKSGGVSWDLADNDQPVYMFGENLYWYKISASGATDIFDLVSITCELVDNTDDSPAFGDLQNVWDGIPISAVEAFRYNARTGSYSLYGGADIYIGNLETDDYIYFNFPFPIYGLYINVGGTPHKNSAVIAGGTDFRLVANGDADRLDYIEYTGERSWSDLGFESGMSITLSNCTTGANDVTANIYAISGRKLHLKGNTLDTTEDGKTGGGDTTVTYTGTLNLAATDDVFEAYNDEGGWTKLGTVALDGTDDLTKSGLVLWDEKVVNFSAKPFNDSKLNTYWYRMSVNDITVPSANIGIEGLIYPIGDQNVGQIAAVGDGMHSTFGLARTVAAWKNRTTYTFDYLPFYVYISAQAGFNVLNGSDFGVIRVGDGRNNPVLAQIQYYNELVVLQEEKGVKGGLVTIIEGSVPEEYGTLVLSDEVGIMNGKAFAMVDGVEVQRQGALGKAVERLKLIFWLSRHGVMVTDGQVIYTVSKDVWNYFDPQDSNSIRRGYEDQNFIWHNKDRRGLEIGLVTGDTATTPNTFLFLDIIDGTISEDTFAQNMSCGVSVEADSGDAIVLAMRGGADTGVVYRVNGKNDVSTAIDMDVVMELNGDGKRIQLDRVATRLKRQDEGTMIFSHALNGEDTFTTGDAARELDMTTGTAEYQRYDTAIEGPKGDLLSLRWRNNELGVEGFLYDVSLTATRLDTNGTVKN